MNISPYDISVWVLPLVFAITFHEAAHGFVAHQLGDNTAWQLGRVSFNPLKHIDPFGTLVLPAILLLSHSPFLFGYAKPVPVNFRALRNPRIGMVLVALAGPATNIALALAGGAAFHLLPLRSGRAPRNGWPTISKIPSSSTSCWRSSTCSRSLRSTAAGSRSDCCQGAGLPLSRLEPYGMLILIGFLIVLPLAGSQFGLNLDVISAILRTSTGYLIRLLLVVTGNG